MVRVHRVGDLLDAREAHEPWPWPGLADALEALVAGDVEPGDAAHAVAWAIDERFARTFPDDWIADGAVERLGVNVLLVPAMSTKTSNFPLAAGRLLHTAQTLTVVANGPLVDDRGASIAHCSMTARPTVGLSLVSWPPGDRTPRRPARSGLRIRWTRGRRLRTFSLEPNSLTHR